MQMKQMGATFFLVLLFSCDNKSNDVTPDIRSKVSFLFKNMGEMDRSAYDSIFFLEGCLNDTNRVYSYISDILMSGDSLFQGLNTSDLIINYYDFRSSKKNKVELIGILEGDTIISVTDKNKFILDGEHTPFLLLIKKGKIASFGMMKKGNYGYLLTFCD